MSIKRFLPSNEIASLIRQLINSDICIIWKENPTTGWLEVVGWASETEPDESYISTIKLNISTLLERKVSEKGNPLFLKDVTRPNLSEIYRYQDEAKERGWKSLITTPLIYQNKIVGLIDVYWYRSIEESNSVECKRELKLLSNLVVKSVISSYSTKPLFQLETIIEELSKIKAEQNLDERLATIVDVGRRMLNAKGGKLYLRIPETKKLVLKCAQGIKFGIHNIGDVLNEGEGMAGEVFLTNKPKIIDEYSKYENRVERLASLFEAVIEVPIRQENELIGVLGVFDNLRDRRFSESEDVPLLSKLADLAGIIIRDQEIIEGNNKRERDLKMVEQVIHEFNTRLDSNELLKTIAELIKKQLHCTHCTIFLPSRKDGRDVLIPMYCAGDNAENIKQRIFYKDEPSLVWRVYLSGKAEIFHDATKHKEFSPARTNKDSSRSLLIAPVKAEGRMVGVISADQDQPVFFNDDDKLVVDILAKHAGIAIERQSAAEILVKNSQLIIEKINREKLDRILEQIIVDALELTHMDSGIIHILNWYGEAFRILRSYKYPETAIYPPARVDENGIPIGLTRNVVETRRPVPVSDTYLYPNIRMGLKNMHHSSIGIPLFYGEEIIGLLFLDDDRIHNFHEAELLRLTTLANHAAAAIRSAQQFENQIEAIDEIARMITVPFNVKNVQQKILAWTNLLLDRASLTVLGIIDMERNDVYAYTSSGKPVEERYRRRVKIGEGVVGKVAQTGQQILLNDVSKFPGYKPLRDDINSELAMPIVINGEIKGVLDINHSKKNAFSEVDIELARAIAGLSGLAFKNADLSFKLIENIVNKERKTAVDLLATDILHKTINLVGTIPNWTKEIRSVVTEQSNENTNRALDYLNRIDREIQLIKSEARRLRPSSTIKSQVNLVNLTGNIIAELKAAFGSTIIFNYEYSGDDVDYALTGIELNIREALSNVLYNAVNAIIRKPTREMGVVSLKMSKEKIEDNDRIVMLIKDNGVGIIQDRWEDIFELGVSDREEILKDESWGYGLWRSKSILRELGGDISVMESTPGQGSTFKISIDV